MGWEGCHDNVTGTGSINLEVIIEFLQSLVLKQSIIAKNLIVSPGQKKMKCNELSLLKQFSLVITMVKRRDDGIYDKRALSWKYLAK